MRTRLTFRHIKTPHVRKLIGHTTCESAARHPVTGVYRTALLAPGGVGMWDLCRARWNPGVAQQGGIEFEQGRGAHGNPLGRIGINRKSLAAVDALRQVTIEWTASST